jgi:lysyl-tRNA synthetase class 1
LGQPLYLVPDPEGCHDSYGEHFLSPLYGATTKLGIEFEIVRAHQLYPQGTFVPYIKLALQRLGEVRRILEEVSNRRLPDDWAPVQLLSDNNSLREWQYDGWDGSSLIRYKTESGEGGEIDLAESPERVKLDWRLDWPARWKHFNVGVEAFGRDHASKGGSYDTGKAIVEQIFDGRAPYPVPYDFVMIAGQTKKMSKSAGNVVTPLDALEVMPAEALRYFMLKPLPKKQLMLDTGLGLYGLIDEYSKVEEAVTSGHGHEFEQAYRLAARGIDEPVISRVPFSHLVTSYQTARGDHSEVRNILVRTGYEEYRDDAKSAIIGRELDYIARWLERFAPDDIKFSVQDQLPEVALTDAQRGFLTTLAASLEAKEAFQALYRVILGKEFGPKAGWFLASLDRDWLIKRLQLKA